MNDQKQNEPQEEWFDPRDLILLIGLGLLAYGAWLVFPPAGFIVPGAILSSVAIFGVRS